MSYGSHTATKATNRHASQSEELSISMDNKFKLDQLINEYIEGIPNGGTKEYRDKIDEVVEILDGIKKYSTEAIHKAFCQVNGQLVSLKIRNGGNLSPEERKANEENNLIRDNASKLAKAGMSVFSVPSVVLPVAANFDLTATLKDESRKAMELGASNPQAGLQRYTDYLLLHLTGEHPGDRAAAEIARKQGEPIPPVQSVKVPPWNSVNIVTAIYKLNDVDPKWYTRPHAQPLVEALVDRLAQIADKQVFDAYSVANLAEAAPALFKYLERANPKNPILEKRFIGALSKAVENSEELPNEKFADKSFLLSMREIRSCNLSPEGAAALCSYVAKLNHLFSQVSYCYHLPTIAATFHAFNGVSSWTNSPDSERKLTVMLTNLNDRLAKSAQSFEPIAAASIIYGLRGLDVRRLGSDAINQITRTMRLVTDGINTMPPPMKLDHRALSAIAHGLILSLSMAEGGIKRATTDLLSAVEQRLPPETTSFDRLGALCSTLTTLRPHRTEYSSLVNALFADIKPAANQSLLFNKSDPKQYIAWQVIQQAFALYGEVMPPRLQDMIDSMAPYVTSNLSLTQSEARVRSWVSAHPGVRVVDAVFQDGFELDLLIVYKDRLINIEIDGRHHKEPCQKIIDDVRDAYLTINRGYEIVRIPNSATEEQVRQILDSLPQ
jgi:hypothetical protein